jgi:serine protease Do
VFWAQAEALACGGDGSSVRGRRSSFEMSPTRGRARSRLASLRAVHARPHGVRSPPRGRAFGERSARGVLAFPKPAMYRRALMPAVLGAASAVLSVAPSTRAAPPEGSAVTFKLDEVRRGIVQIERAGRPMAVGMVLRGDGRIVTSLSALGNADFVDIRYADNHVIRAKLAHWDGRWDLALLVPQTGRWTEGFTPMDTDPREIDLRAFVPKAGRLSGTNVRLRAIVDAKSQDGQPLQSVMVLEPAPVTPPLGTPLIAPDGKAAGVMVRVCKGAEEASAPGCDPIVVGAPVYALRSFLMKTPASASVPAPWLGLGGVRTEENGVKGVRVVGLAPGSPAARAGLRFDAPNPDTILAVDGQPVESPEQLAEAVSRRGIGETMKLLVVSQGKFRDVAVTLQAAPSN